MLEPSVPFLVESVVAGLGGRPANFLRSSSDILKVILSQIW